MERVYAVEVINVHKSFGRVKAVDGVSFNVKPGEIMCLVGPNGAGKTTTLKMIVGLLRPDKGVVRIYGFDVQRERVKALSYVGYVPENPVVPMALTVEEFVSFIAYLRGLDKRVFRERFEYYIDLFGLKGRERSILGSLSRGMLQKVLIISALIVKPRVLVLDEPMTGLDPEAQYAFRKELIEATDKGVSVIMSSHLLDLVEKICHRVALMRDGKIVVEGSVEEIKQLASSGALDEAFIKLIRGGG